MREPGLGGLRGFGDPFAEPEAPPPSLDSVRVRLAQIREAIDRTCVRVGREPSSVKIIGVTKTLTVEEIQPALEAGLDDLGENYVQEARKKAAALPGTRWHMIGNLQRNKVNLAVDLFEGIHSLDSLPLIRRLDERCKARNRKLWGLLQIKQGGEKSKQGLKEDAAFELLDALRKEPLEFLRLTGLMSVPPPVDDPEQNRPHFRALRTLLGRIQEQGYPFWSGSELSMGMSDDYLVAVEEGATMVRLGRAVFGERH
ncbi:MAG: YggS family pyridoxal phosphate-dependent enzyme [Armatimonadetes bacterium]|nr:YggS family pyridoxal phosphate-dependent enzyme [Armatimonadota bacterium]